MSNRSRRAKQFAVLGGSALVAAPMLGSGVADAATIEVTNLNDSGAGSLRDAIEQADGDAAADTITFAPGLTGTINLASELAINSPMTIAGPGAGSLIIDGGDSVRVLYLYSNSEIAVTISGITATQGFTAANGGAVKSVGPIDLTVDGVSVLNSQGNYGGGIYIDGGDLTVTDSTISGNTASYGGGIYQEGDDSDVTIVDSEISGNSAPNGAGGLYFDSANSSLEITRSLFQTNTSGGGGAAEICAESGSVIITDSSFIANNSTGVGGALYFEQECNPSVLITGSTFWANVASETGGAMHFGYAYYLDTTIVDSTISANSALYGGGVYLVGLYDTTNSFTISHSTITNNSATGTDENYNGGGGIYLGNDGFANPGQLLLDHTVVAGNTSTTPGDDVVVVDGGEIVAKWSMIGNLDGFTVTEINRLPEGDPMLGALADNGGPTMTHLPLAGSPLINGGNPDIPGYPDFDQRGYARIGGGRIDVGAVESDSGAPVIPDTGSSSGTLALIGAALLAVGGALHLTDRRRTRQL